MQEKSKTQSSAERRSALETTSQYIWRHVDFACGVGVGLALASFIFLVMHVHHYFNG